MQLNISSNIREQIGWLGQLEKQVPFATALALTKTGQDVQKDIYAEQAKVFDRPTRYTQSAFFLTKATKVKLYAEVRLKDRSLSKTQRTPAQIIGHQYEGGTRASKSIERYAVSAGLLSPNEVLVPSVGARLDGYGNMSRGQVAQVLSQLRLGLDVASFKSKSARSVRTQKRARLMFWSRGGHLPRGVWVRTLGGVLPVLMVAANVRYRQLLDVPRLGERTALRVFDAHFSAAWAKAKSTAR